jgi:threonyl-tRNA synthetase
MPFLTHPVADNFSFQPFKKTIFVFFKQKGSLRRKTLLKLIYEEHSEFLHYSPY